MYSIFKCDIVNPDMKHDKYRSIAQRISFLFLILMIPVFLLFCLLLYIQFHYQKESDQSFFIDSKLRGGGEYYYCRYEKEGLL